MPCTKCKSDFNIRNWKLKCMECEENHCSRCLRKNDNYAICGVCSVLIKRPPNRTELMDLKVKDLQAYLNRHEISTHGIVEKPELVELFFLNAIPVRYKKSKSKFPASLGGSVPNLTARSMACLQNIKRDAENALSSVARNVPRPDINAFGGYGGSPARTPPHPRSPTRPSPTQQGTPFSHNGTPRMQPASPVRTPTAPTSPTRNLPTSPIRTPNGHNASPVRPPQPTTSSVNTNASGDPDFPLDLRNLPKLSDHTTVDELRNLSVKQIKQLLSLNRVNYTGCVEKSELLDKLERLWTDSKQKRELEDDEECCKICMDAPMDCVLLECGHIASCIECGKRLSECPICRQYVVRVVRTFKA